MSVIKTKSISGITSITTPSGGDNLLTIHTSDTTERVRVNNSGDVIVGTGVTLSPDGDVYTTGVTTATTFVGALTGNVTGNVSGNVTGNVTGTSSKVTITSGADNRIVTAAGADTLNAETNAVINGGVLIVGHTAGTTCSDGENPFIQIKGPDSRAGSSFIRHSADASAGGLYMGKSRNATIGSNTIVQDDDELGRITWSGDDGTDINTAGAKIAAYVDGTPGANDMPGRLEFYTTSDGAASPTPRMYIKANGFVGITQAEPTTNLNVSGGFHISGTATQTKTQDGLLFQRNTSSGSCEIIAGRAGGNYAALEHYIAGASGVTLRQSSDYQGTTKWMSGNGSTELFRIRHDGGVTFNGDTASANALDDYEEGTWTPAYTSSNATFGYATQQGVYKKIGSLVWVQAYIATNSVSSTSHSLVKVSGLPFQVDKRTPGSIRCTGFQGSSWDDFPTAFSFEHNQTHGELQRMAAGGNTDFTTSNMNNNTYVYIAGCYTI